jgi:hypothetical protein
MATEININGIQTLDFNLDGTTTASLTSPGVIEITNTLPIATTSSLGVVEPDGVTIDINPEGVISVPTATTSSLGLVKPDGTTITISGGVISAVEPPPPAFNNITSGTNTTATMIVGTGATIEASGTGIINATELKGISSTGGGVALTTGPITSTAGDIATFTNTSGQIVDSGILASSLAPKASPAFTGVPTAPTATAGTNTTQIATTAFVEAATSGGGTPPFTNITSGTNTTAAMVVGTGSSLTTSGTGTINATEVTGKVPTGGGAALTTGPSTSVIGDVATFTSTTGAVQDSGTLLSSLAPLTSPTFTGVPAAPTAAFGTSTTQIATTAFVEAAVGSGAPTTFSAITTGTNTAATMSVGNGAALEAVGTGVINATELNGLVNTGGGVSIPTGPVTSVTGDVVIFTGTAGEIADSGVVLTSLAPKASPALTGTPTAPTATAGTNNTQIATTAFVDTALTAYAPLASPTLTGTPTGPTATAGTNTTQLATTAFVQEATGGGGTPPFTNILSGTNTTAAMVVGTGASLDVSGTGAINATTLEGKSIAGAGAAIPTGPAGSTGNDIVTFTGTGGQLQDSGVQISSLAPKASPALTGTPTAPTASAGTNTTQLATTAFVQAADTALLVSPAFTGTPTAPTAAPGTNTTQIATTAFVEAATSGGTPPFSAILTGTNTTATMTVGSGGELTYTTGGIVNASELAGLSITGAGAAIPTGPTTSTPGDVVTFTGTSGQLANSGTLLTSLAPLASPTFTGTPSGPTASPGTNTTQLATTAFVEAATSGGTPAFSNITTGTNTAATMTVGTGGSLTFSGTGTVNASEVSGKALTGAGTAIPTGPTSTTVGNVVEFSTATGQIADSGLLASSLATLASPAFTGAPTAPTATAGTNTTQIATTAFVETAVAGGVGSSPFNAITSGTNTTAAMVVGSGGSLSVTGTGVLNANEVNGAVVPASALALASNSSHQIVAATLGGSGSAITTGPNSSTGNDIVTFFGTAGQIQDSGVQISALATLASPTFTGTPAAPTASLGTNTTQIATTAFVDAAVAAGVGSTPFANLTTGVNNSASMVVDTGGSLSFADSGVINASKLTGLLPVGGGAAIPTGPSTSTSGDIVTFGNTTGELADSGTLLSSLAPLASPALTGTPTAPTATAGTNTTQVATTAFVTGAIAGGVATPFSVLTSGTNTTATMTVGTGGSLTTSGTGIVNANEVNASALPASTAALATNSSKQIVAATLAGSGAGLVTGPTTAVSGDFVVFTGTGGQIADSGLAVASFAPINSPAFTGVPTAPTATSGTNTTQLATTAFVAATISGNTGNAVQIQSVGVNPVAPTNGELLQYSSASGLWVPESALCYPEAPADSPSAYDDEFNVGTTLSSIWTPTTGGSGSYTVNTSPYKSCVAVTMPSSGSTVTLNQPFAPGTADFSATIKIHTPYFATTPVFELDFGVYASTANAAYMLVETNASFKAFSEVSGTFTQLGSTLTSSTGAAFTGCFLMHVQRKSGAYSFYFSPYPGAIWTLINATAYTPSALTVANLRLGAGYDSGTGAIPVMLIDWVRVNWMFR